MRRTGLEAERCGPVNGPPEDATVSRFGTGIDETPAAQSGVTEARASLLLSLLLISP